MSFTNVQCCITRLNFSSRQEIITSKMRRNVFSDYGPFSLLTFSLDATPNRATDNVDRLLLLLLLIHALAAFSVLFLFNRNAYEEPANHNHKCCGEVGNGGSRYSTCIPQYMPSPSPFSLSSVSGLLPFLQSQRLHLCFEVMQGEMRCLVSMGTDLSRHKLGCRPTRRGTAYMDMVVFVVFLSCLFCPFNR